MLKTFAVLSVVLAVAAGCGTGTPVDTRPVETRAESPSAQQEPSSPAPRVLGCWAPRRGGAPRSRAPRVTAPGPPGGRGGRVLEVTNLKNAGRGSFRAAATASGRRIIVFDSGLSRSA